MAIPKTKHSSRFVHSFIEAKIGVELLEILGEGFRHIVYKIKYNGSIRALKILKNPSFQDSRNIINQRREVFALARLQHPGLMSIDDEGTVDGYNYIIVEYIDGPELAQLLAEKEFSETDIIDFAFQLAEILVTVHSCAITHRDIKPNNILVTNEGRYKLIDFEFSQNTDIQAADAGTAFSFDYCSPEQIHVIKSQIDERSDLYSLGVILYQMATRRLPFEVVDLSSLMQAHVQQKPKAISDLSPHINPKLAAVIHTLIQRDPLDRYQNAEELLLDLKKISSLGTERSSLPKLSKFVGRFEEVSLLQKEFQKLADHRGHISLICGEPGLGKSRLAAEAISEFKNQGGIVLSGKCSREDPLPFSVFRSSIEGFFQRSAVQGEYERYSQIFKEAGKSNEKFLKIFSPSLKKIFADAETPTELGDEYLDALAEFFLAFAQVAGGLVIVLDDVQWLDPASWQVVARISNSLRDSPLILIATSRNDDDSQPALEKFKYDMKTSLSHVIVLSPLTSENVSSYVHSHLGGRHFDSRIAAVVYENCRGYPFTMLEVLNSLIDDGVIHFKTGAWAFDEEIFQTVNLPTNTVELVISRFNKISDEAKYLLGAAGVIGAPFDLETLNEVLGPELPVAKWLTECLASKLIERIGQNNYSFIHDCILEASLKILNEETKRKLHTTTIIAIQKILTSDSSTADATIKIGEHYFLSDLKWTFQSFAAQIASAQCALSNHGLQSAKESYERALEIGKKIQAPIEWQVYQELCQINMSLGVLDDAVMYAHRALESCDIPINRALIYNHLAKISLSSNDSVSAQVSLKSGFEELGMRLPSRATQTPVSVAKMLLGIVIGGFFKKGLPLSKERREKYEAIVNLCSTGFYAASFNLDLVLTINVALDSYYVGQILGPSRAKIQGLVNLGLVLSCALIEKPALRCFKAASDISQMIGDDKSYVNSLFSKAIGLSFLGKILEAEKIHIANLKNSKKWIDTDDLSSATGDLGLWYTERGKIKEGRYWILSVFNDRLKLNSSDKNQTERRHPWLAWSAMTEAWVGSQEKETYWFGLAQAQLEETKNPPWMQANYFRFQLNSNLAHSRFFAESTESAIAGFEHVAIGPVLSIPQVRSGYVYSCYMRYEQFLNCPASEKKKYYRLFKKSLVNVWLSSLHPVFRLSYLILKAADLVILQKYSRAQFYLERAEQLATELEAPWHQYEICRVKARLFKKMDDSVRFSEAVHAALRLCQDNGWKPLSKKIFNEFSIEIESRNRMHTQLVDATDSVQFSLLSRKLEALKQISTVSASSLHPETLAKDIAFELFKIINAEKCLVFTGQFQNTVELTLLAGFDNTGKDLSQTENLKFSKSLIEKSVQNREAFLFSGDPNSEFGGSDSIVANQLRSIMVAPLVLQDRVLGAIYLDSTLARHLFNQPDLELLKAVSNQIALSFETAAKVKLEIEKNKLTKELEVAASVQKLLMPGETSFDFGDGFHLEAFFRPADQCSGDWWYAEAEKQSPRFVIGDVTGHGVSSAIMTSAIAGGYINLSAHEISLSLEEILLRLNSSVIQMVKDEFLMSLVAAEKHQDEIHLYGFAAPEGILFDASGNLQPVCFKGHMLGLCKTPDFTKQVLKLQKGERLLLFTDGLIEFTDKHGVPFNQRRLNKIVKETCGSPLNENFKKILSGIYQFLPDRLEDDVTILMIGRD